MRLSEAILLGAKICTPKGGNLHTGADGACAIGMSELAVGRKTLAMPELSGAIGAEYWKHCEAAKEWPWLLQATKKRHSPKCCHVNLVGDPLIMLVTHVFDSHVDGYDRVNKPWTLEQLVDYVRSIEPAELPDISLSRQHELEEIEAEREGGDTAAAGYPEPGRNPRFA